MSALEAKNPITVEHDGAVDWLTLNRPGSLNAITQSMIEALHTYFESLTQNYSVRVVVLRGAGRAFCAGLDLNEGPPARRHDQPHKPQATLSGIIRLMRACPQPIIALLHGPACGGGFSFALASDIRIAGDSARLNDAYIKLGLSGCELGTSFFLPRIVGLSMTAELMYTGDFIDAATALRTGLVSRLVPDAELNAAAASLIKAMLKTSPLGLRSTKQTLNQALKLSDLDAIIDLEERTQILCMQAPEFREALNKFASKK